MDKMVKQRVWLALNLVPPGTVVTYGQLAEMAGLSRRHARLIGTVLSQLPSGSTLPWFRVINHKGKISFPPDSERYTKQRSMLEDEGVFFTGDKVSLQRYGWTD